MAWNKERHDPNYKKKEENRKYQMRLIKSKEQDAEFKPTHKNNHIKCK